MDKAVVFSIAGTRVEYSAMLVNKDGKVQVPGPKLNRFFGYSGQLTLAQMAMLPPSCLETVSLGKETPGWYAYTARPVLGGVKVQAPMPEYCHKSVILTDCEALADYLEVAINSPLYVQPQEGDDDDEV